MAIIQISKIQQRSGNLVDLPQLDEAQLGWANDAKIEKYKQQLKAALDAEGIKYSNRFYFFGYNAPFEVFNRKNEIIVELQ